MLRGILGYFRELFQAIGEGWNEFWFQRSDPATLGLIRVGAGLVALYFAGSYSLDLERFFGADGLLPAATVGEWLAPGENRWWRFSYFSLANGRADLWAMHVVSLLVLLLFTLGLFTRVTSVLALLVVLAYVQRAPMLTSQLEPVLCLVLFCLALGPSGAARSLDAWRARRRRAELPAAERALIPEVPLSYGAHLAQRMLQVHLALIYPMMGLSKLLYSTNTSDNVWLDGQAVWWLAAKPESRLFDLTSTLAALPKLGDFWSHVILAVELSFAVLIWIRLARPLVLLTSTVVWLSLAVLTGNIPWAVLMIVANLAFVSGEGLRDAFSGWGFRRGGEAAPAAARA